MCTRSRLSPILTAVFAALCPLGLGQEDLTKRLAALVDGAVEQDSLEGLAAVIELGGEGLLARGAGGISPETEVPVACLMDWFTTIAVMQQADTGKLVPDAPLADTVESLAWKGESVTLHHLLTHTSGIPEIAGLGSELQAIEALFRLKSPWKQIAQQPLLSTPGSCQQFSSTNTYLAGVVVEEATGKPLGELLAANVFKPLDLSSTRFDDEVAASLEAAGTQVSVPGGGAVDTSGAARFGAGGLVTSAADLARIMGGLAGGTLLDTRSRAHLLGTHRLSDGQSLRYAHGLSKTGVDSFSGVTAGGSVGRTSVHVAYLPDLDVVVALSGWGEAERLEDLAERLVREVFDLPLASIGERTLPEGTLERVVGVYKLGCDRLVLSASADGELVFSGGARPVRRMLYQGAHTFVAADDHGIRIQLQVEGGQAQSLVLTESGTQAMAVRVEAND